MQACALEMREVDLARGGRSVLEDVSAHFERARVTAVCGPSGAGKTSLLRCLNRLEEPQAGRVTIDDTDVRMLPPTELRRRVGMIFQTPVLFEGGVRANLTYGLDGVDNDVLAHALESAGLSASFLERESPALSVGQAQRVCIARALVRRPQALLMDEPTSALDQDAARKIEELIGRLVQERLTIVLVTHNLEQARRVASDAILLVDGRVTAAGSPEEIAAAWPEEAP